MDYIRISGLAASRRGVEYDVSIVTTEKDSEVGSPTDRWVALSMFCAKKNLKLLGVRSVEYIDPPTPTS